MTLIELSATIATLIMGLLAMGQIVLETVKQNRRTLAAQQARLLAERELEQLLSIGCIAPPNAPHPCQNIIDLETGAASAGGPLAARQVYWTASGPPQDVVGPIDPSKRLYTISIDVDPPFEGAERGAPDLTRQLANGEQGSIVNVRITVSWTDSNNRRDAVAVQTRMSPS
jgi:hypothetical protein